MNNITLSTLKSVDGLTMYTDAGLNGTKDKIDYVIALSLVCDCMCDNELHFNTYSVDCWNGNGCYTGESIFHRDDIEYIFNCTLEELKKELQSIINKAD